HRGPNAMNPRYVVATDLSPESRTALAAAVTLARRTGASIDLLCAVPTSLVDEEEELLARVRAGLARIARRVQERDLEVRTEVVVTSDVPRAIAARAASTKADLVACGPSGVTGWKKFVLGSVT